MPVARLEAPVALAGGVRVVCVRLALRLARVALRGVRVGGRRLGKRTTLSALAAPHTRSRHTEWESCVGNVPRCR